jgi:hypothetical protein
MERRGTPLEKASAALAKQYTPKAAFHFIAPEIFLSLREQNPETRANS